MQVVVDGYAWLPLDSLTGDNVIAIEQALTVYPKNTSDIDKGDPEPIKLYRYGQRRSRECLGVPREFYRQHKMGSHEELLFVSEGEPMSPFESTVAMTGEFAEQAHALNAFLAEMARPWAGGILRAGCGWGKSSWALELARQLGRKTIIVVHKDFLLKQWKARIREQFPGARVGIIRQDVCDYDNKDFVVAIVHSLANAVDDGSRYPHEMWGSFGTVITDECHRVGATTWNPVVPRFAAKYRIGLSATPKRKDGADDAFRLHIGPILFNATKEMMVPQLKRVWTSSRLRPISRGKYQVSVPFLNKAQILSQLAGDAIRTRMLAEQTLAAMRIGRKVFVMSERLEHLRDIASELSELLMRVELPFEPVLDFYVGEWFTGRFDAKGNEIRKKRTEAELDKAERANVIFATKQMVEEGLDIQALDVLVLATPISDVEQTVGRVRRICKPSPDKCARLCAWRAGVCTAKPTPVVVDMIDEEIDRAMTSYESRKRLYTKLGMC